MLNIENLSDITKNGLCIGCGVCQSLVGKDKISISMTDKGRLEPEEVKSLSSEDFDKIKKVCPGVLVEGLPIEEVNEKSKSSFGFGYLSYLFVLGDIASVTATSVKQLRID